MLFHVGLFVWPNLLVQPCVWQSPSQDPNKHEGGFGGTVTLNLMLTPDKYTPVYQYGGVPGFSGDSLLEGVFPHIHKLGFINPGSTLVLVGANTYLSLDLRLRLRTGGLHASRTQSALRKIRANRRRVRVALIPELGFRF